MKMFDGFQEVKVIRGWDELCKVTGLGYQRVRREIGHYGFPKPRKVQTTNIWLEDEVLQWLAERTKNDSAKRQ